MIGTLLLNRYELIEKIGEGGMGIVYKAKCNTLNRYVAIKVLKPYLNNQVEIIARFKKEAHSIASLSHPNIVGIYDIGSENNINFLVMEYINGKSLDKIIRENNKLSTSKALDIASQIAEALDFAHSNKIIHRDIKPDNILITEDNTAKLTDFGIAKVANSMTITNSDNIVGSVHYFSPEQAKGNFIDSRTDIYALGSVLYKMVTGQVPFSGDTSIAVAMMHINNPVTPPKNIVNYLPENINAVILKALEKNPIDRFQTAGEFAEILNSIRNNPDLEVNFGEKLIDSPTIEISNSHTLISHSRYNSTVVIDKNSLKKRPTFFNKIMLVTGSIALTLIVSFVGIYLSKETKETPSTETISNQEKENQAETATSLEEKKTVPSLIGQSLDNAQNIILGNGFVIGNIVNEYSNTVPKGSVINQSPLADSPYENNGKINLVISQGPQPTEPVQQVNETGTGNQNEKAKGKSKKEKNNK
ncbi:Stk1 family PASTA domain-containing Ser/Thr kinase [Clostridium cibarium]|uniref:non-specific serine/threonine protein kinase n=1 Tax=Clostridium cibarium TaxID=2762247 RepID=A0ABR8PXE1_9CLOT|nr:Stk1 family PASTA domain-containing Ser/Thr kinase [Clostridium cibarium]MBD7912826.1 Stk1 family PASTA domain-containing Ser/Thr kinase [Clostridium cibarium]